MRRPASFAVDPGVFWVSLVISLLFVAWGVFFTDNLATVAGAALDFVIANFGWVFILASFGFLAFVVFLAFSRYGRIRLGNDDDRPEFRTVSWVAMMFSAAFVISAVTGVHRGIQWLANTNMVLAIFLLLFVFVLGPTVFILNTFVESLGGYIARLVPMSFRSGAFSDDSWLASWTIFYWAWWISWTPFVGTFIARISRGRTIREFIIGMLLVPSVVSFIWFAILGGAAVNLELAGVGNISEAVNRGLENALFSTLNEFPLAWLTSLIAIILVAIFFVSGADAASVVMGMLSSHGALEPNRVVIVIWGTLTGAAAAILLLTGGLTGLQTGAILSAVPFVLVMIGLCWSIFKGLSSEPVIAPEPTVAPEPGRAASRPRGAPAPQQMSAENPQDRG